MDTNERGMDSAAPQYSRLLVVFENVSTIRSERVSYILWQGKY
jgi:hypothetical protein